MSADLYNRQLEEKIMGIVIGKTMTIPEITDSIISEFPSERRKVLKRRVWYTVKRLIDLQKLVAEYGETSKKTKILLINVATR